MNNRHTLSVLVENKPGVLTRFTGLIARRGFNIHSLAVGVTEHEELSRITVVVDVNDVPLEQVPKQLNKLVNVIKIVELEPETSVRRGHIIYKVKANSATRPQVAAAVEMFSANIVEVGLDSVSVVAIGKYVQVVELRNEIYTFDCNRIDM